jgi:hypothetical protein
VSVKKNCERFIVKEVRAGLFCRFPLLFFMKANYSVELAVAILGLRKWGLDDTLLELLSKSRLRNKNGKKWKNK